MKRMYVLSTNAFIFLRFHAVITDFFNDEEALDLFWLDGKGALKVVEICTGYVNSVFLEGETAEDVRTAFVGSWTTVFPHIQI